MSKPMQNTPDRLDPRPPGRSGGATRHSEGTVALVTGGGTGIGRATAIRLAELGHRVVVTGRRREPLQDLASAREGIEALSADVGRPESAATLRAEILDRFGGLDVLVNNAGRFSAASLREVDEPLLADLFRVNVFAPFRLFRTFLPLLAKREGAVVNVSSTLATKATPGAGLYGASKAALEQLTRSWALEAAPLGVRVNAVAPGPTETDILARSGLDATAVAEIRAAERDAIPLGRRGSPDEVARWIVELAVRDASWVTGQVLRIDGGLSVP